MRNSVYRSAILMLVLLSVAACDTSEPQSKEVEDVPDRFVEISEEVENSREEPLTREQEPAIPAVPANKKPVKTTENPDLADAETASQKLNAGQAKAEVDESGLVRGVGVIGDLSDLEGRKSGVAELGLQGTGRGGGGEGFGRIGGLGTASSSGYGRGVSVGAKGRRAPRVRMGSPQVKGYSAKYGGKRAPQGSSADAAGTEGYQDYGTNKFTDPSKDPQSTFAIDVDTGAYTIARRKLNEGMLPPAASVRVEEFINYFGYSYPAPESDAFAVSLEGAPSPFSAEKNRYVMRVGVQGKTLDDASRKPVHLTFLVDVSGSMSRPDKIGLAKESLKYLTKHLKQHDTVAISTYAGNVTKVLDPTGMEHRGKILDAIDGLNSGGSTAMNDGLQLAYKLAMKSFEPGHVNRVIVLSDGDANVGPVSHEDILKRIKSYVDEGVTLSTIGFGMGNYKDTLMEQLANKGNGNYFYIDSMREAQRIFGEQLDGTLQVIAKDVKIQVDFDPDKVSKYRLIGYENRDIADKDFRNDKIDAGEIGAGHRVTALYEVELKQPQAHKIATVRIRHKKPTAHTATEREFYFGADDLAKSVGQASKDFQWATAVAGFAELLRKSPYSKHLSWDLVLEVAQASTRGKKERKEMIGLIKKARKIAG